MTSHRSDLGPAFLAPPAGPPGCLGERRAAVATVTGGFGVAALHPEYLASGVSVWGSSLRPPVLGGAACLHLAVPGTSPRQLCRV